MVQPAAADRNALHELGYKIFLDRYALKDMTRATLAVGDTVIVVVNPKTGQREVGVVEHLTKSEARIKLLDGEVVTRDIEHVDKPLETRPEQMMDRVASGIAKIEQTDAKRVEWTDNFRWLLDGWKFVPGGRILTGAGTDQNLTYYNCFVVPSPRDSRGGIMETLSQMTEIMSRGGGVGINISTLRPRHAYVKGVNGRSSGSVSWGALYSFVTGLIEQGGCFGPDERIATDKGLIPAAELADRIDAGETFYAQTHKGWRPITMRFRNGEKPLYEVITGRGYRVRITAEHKVAVLRGADVVTIPLHELKVGDDILVLMGEGAQGDYVTLKSVQYDRSVMSTTLNTDVVLPETLTEDLAYFLGYSYADGYVQIGKKVNWSAPKALKLATADAHPTIRDRLMKITQATFGLTPTLENGDGSSMNVAVYSRMMIEWLSQNGLLKQKTADIRVPEAIFRSPSSVQTAFIAGYFDADGCDRGRKGGYGIDSISLEGLRDLQQLLAFNGIVSRIHTTDRSEKGWQTIYRLSVTGRVFKERFSSLIPAEKVDLETNGKREENTYSSEVWTGLGARSKFRQRIYDGVSDRISPAQLMKISARMQESGETVLAERINDLLHVLPDPIASITPIGVSDVYDFEVDDVHLLAGNCVYTSNSRRGALMLILNDWHPDVFNFISSKRQAGQITNANISVGISDALMEAVKVDGDWDLMFPDTSDPDYDTAWDGDLEAWQAAGRKVHTYKTVKAREVWNAIIESAWASAEPGVWFRDRSNKLSNSHYFHKLICTNPCFTGDTRVYTSEGLVKAEDLWNDETDIAVAVDSRFGIKHNLLPATRVFMTGVKPVYKLETEEGYSVRTTADHRFMTPSGWVELQDLKPGDRVHILNRKGGFGRQGSLELGRVLGWLVGDGTIKKDGAVLSFFGEEKGELAPVFAHYVDKLVAPLVSETAARRNYPVGVGYVSGRDEARVGSTRLRRLVETYGLTEEKLQVPDVVFRGTEDMQRGFLQALFTADGSVQYSSGTLNVRLASSHAPLLQQTQQVLSNFGIASRIYQNRRIGQYRMMPDGKGGQKEYWTEAQHELVISKASAKTFATEIGFILARKQQRLEEIIDGYVNGLRADTFTVRIKSVTSDGEEAVYDLTENLAHSVTINGLITHNCGEQSLPAFGICNLGAVNLAAFYDGENHDVAWDDLGQAVRYGVRFLDNVIDSTPYFFAENARVQGAERRVGLGTMGIAELMVKLKIRYGSPESLEFIDRVYYFIAENAYLMSAEIAAEKGSFPAFDADQFLESGFMLGMPEHIRQTIREKGIRNVTLLTQAPTGCVAPDTLVSTAMGLEAIATLGDPHGEQWQISPRNVYTDSGLKMSSHFFVNGYQPVKKITTQRGFNITATHNHRLRVIDANGDYVWRRMDEMQVGDTVVMKKNTLGQNQPIPLQSVQQGNRALSDLPSHLTPALAEILGLYMGDGYLKKRGGIHIVVGKSDPDLLDYIRGHLSEIFPAKDADTNRNMPAEDRAGCWTLNLTGYYIQRFFEINGFAKPSGNHGEGAAGAFIPDAVLRGGREIVAGFLRGLFESDGSVSRGTITLSSTSQKLIQQVQIALLGLGIIATVRAMPESDNPIGTRTVYELRILNRREATRFVETVGFLSSRKRAKADDLGNMSNRGDSIASQPLLTEFYARSEGIGHVGRQNIHSRVANGALTQDYVRTMTTEHPQLMESRLAQLVDMDIYLDQIESIENAMTHTFDISVPDNHTYIANGFVSHNTTGTMVNTSTGIEPFYSWVYYRKSRLGIHEERVPVAQEYFDANPGETELPEYFATAMSLSPEDHVRAQAAFQRWVDSSISKTCNVPYNYTLEQVSELYKLMYETGCKGGTIYRDGSRDEQVLMLKGDERAEKEMAEKDTKKAEAKSDAKPVSVTPTATPHRVYPRPKKLQGMTVTTPTPFGTAYVTMNMDDNGMPFEVFITAPGKAGSDLQADAEGLGRLVSLSLRTTEPHNRRQMLKLIVEQLRDIGGSRTAGFGSNRVTSLPDAVARALEDHFLTETTPAQLSLPLAADPMPDKPKPATSAPITLMESPMKSNGNGNGGGHRQEAVDNTGYEGADMCPECHTISLMRVEGCRKCLTCGYSEC